MTEVWFYHLQRASLEAVLPNLVERSLDKGWRVNIRCTTADRVVELDRHLWTFDQSSFLPHGTKEDGNEQRQPVYITSENDNPNNAQVLFLIDGATEPHPSVFERCILVFDGHDEIRVSEARAYWSSLKDQDVDLQYWQQHKSGKWERTS